MNKLWNAHPVEYYAAVNRKVISTYCHGAISSIRYLVRKLR